MEVKLAKKCMDMGKSEKNDFSLFLLRALEN
jgi:hypothetical protein